MPYRDILIPLDGSAPSKQACAEAFRLAEALPGQQTIHLLHCVLPIPFHIAGPNRQMLMADNQKQAEELFRPGLELFAKIGQCCHTYVRYGEPGPTIVQAAEDLSCELIVMGCRGMGNLKSMVFGSVSTHVAMYAQTPVLLATASQPMTYSDLGL